MAVPELHVQVICVGSIHQVVPLLFPGPVLDTSVVAWAHFLSVRVQVLLYILCERETLTPPCRIRQSGRSILTGQSWSVVMERSDCRVRPSVCVSFRVGSYYKLERRAELQNSLQKNTHNSLMSNHVIA